MWMVLFVSTAILSDVPGSQGSGDWLARFNSEGLQAMEKLETLCDDLEVHVKFESDNYSGRPQLLEVLIHHPWQRVEITRPSEPEAQRRKRAYSTVAGRNSKYSFVLSRYEAGGRYVMENFGNPRAPIDRRADAILTHSLCAPWRVFDKSLREWLETPEFAVKRVRPILHEGRQLAELTVEYKNQQDIRATAMPAFTGRITLDPERHWCICQVDCVMHHIRDGSVVARIPSQRFTEFGEMVGAYPMPKVVRGVIKGDPQSSTRHFVATDTYTITKVIPRKPAEREFTLSHYGLPEPLGHQFAAPTSYLWLWMVFGAIALLAVAWLLVKYRRKPAQAAT